MKPKIKWCRITKQWYPLVWKDSGIDWNAIYTLRPLVKDFNRRNGIQ